MPITSQMLSLPRFASRCNKFGNIRKGLTLIEVGVVLMVSVMALSGGAVIYSDYLKSQTNNVTAQQMKDVGAAFERYVTDNYAQLVASAQATGWARVPVSDLQPQYLSEAFLNKNPFGQNYVLAVRKPSPGVANLEAVVFTTGGEEIEPDRALAISQHVGASGGFTLKGGSVSQVRATFDGYQLDLHDFGVPGPSGSGKLVSALFMNEIGSISQDFLYRSRIPGRPELNQMTTNLGMNDKNINDVNQLNASQVKTTGSITSGGEIYTDADVRAGGDVVATHSLRGQNVQVKNNIEAGGSVSGATLVPTMIATANASCATFPPGAVAKTSQGGLLSCDSGTWKAAGGGGQFGGAYAVNNKYGCGQYDGSPSANPITGGCSCPAGYSAITVSAGGKWTETEGWTTGFVCVKP